jgi:predicted aspartyl protease
MRARVGLASIIAIAATAAPLQAAEPSQGTVPLAAIDSTTQVEDIAFKNDGYERMTVPVVLSDTGPYRFLVDTGADRSAVSQTLVDRLQLRRSAPVRLHSVTGVSAVQTASLPSLRLTSSNISVDGAAVLNDDHMGADGILGVDSLRSQRVEFDFKANRMSVVPAAQIAAFQATDPQTIVISAKRKSGRLVITNAKVDREAVRAVLDTGAQITIGNEALRRRLMRTRGIAQPGGNVEIRSVTGEQLPGDYMVLTRLEIGGAVLRNVAIVFADAHSFKQLGLDRRPAMLLGMNALRAFDKVSIDFANKKLRLILPRHSDSRQLQLASLIP